MYREWLVASVGSLLTNKFWWQRGGKTLWKAADIDARPSCPTINSIQFNSTECWYRNICKLANHCDDNDVMTLLHFLIGDDKRMLCKGCLKKLKKIALLRREGTLPYSDRSHCLRKGEFHFNSSPSFHKSFTFNIFCLFGADGPYHNSFHNFVMTLFPCTVPSTHQFVAKILDIQPTTFYR